MNRTSLCGEVLLSELPVHEAVKERIDELRTGVAVVDVVGVLPDVQREKRLLIARERRAGVARVDDGQRAVGILHEPRPAGTEVARSGGRKGLAEGVIGTPDCIDRLKKGAFGHAAALRLEALPEERVVEDLGRIVEHAARGGADDFLKGLAFEVRAGDQAVQIVDVGLMMLAPVEFQGFTTHGGLEGVERIRKSRQSKHVGISPEPVGI